METDQILDLSNLGETADFALEKDTTFEGNEEVLDRIRSVPKRVN
jgi:hypothetical protein